MFRRKINNNRWIVNLKIKTKSSIRHKEIFCRYIFRYSHAGSTHTLNNYCDTSDNWTDHDMDIYMARNPTTRNGLVPLWDRCYAWYFHNYYHQDKFPFFREILWHQLIQQERKKTILFKPVSGPINRTHNDIPSHLTIFLGI